MEGGTGVWVQGEWLSVIFVSRQLLQFPVVGSGFILSRETRKQKKWNEDTKKRGEMREEGINAEESGIDDDMKRETKIVICE